MTEPISHKVWLVVEKYDPGQPWPGRGIGDEYEDLDLPFGSEAALKSEEEARAYAAWAHGLISEGMRYSDAILHATHATPEQARQLGLDLLAAAATVERERRGQ